METFIQLNLQSDGKESYNINPEGKELKDPESPAIRKKLKRIGDKAAHKAAIKLGRSKLDIFSK